MIFFNLSKDNMKSLPNFIVNGIKSGENEFQVLYGDDNTGADDILSWEDYDYEQYSDILEQISDIITGQYKKDNLIAVNILTKLIVNEKPIIIGTNPEQFLFCKHCVCSACLPDTNFFKTVTNVEFIPPIKFCRRSFVEYTAGRKLISKMKINLEVPDIDYKEYINIIFRMYGNTLGIGADYFGL